MDTSRPIAKGIRAVLIPLGLWLTFGPNLLLADSEHYIRGDAQVNHILDVSDVVAVLGYLFLQDPSVLACADAADANDDGSVDVGDPIFLLFYLFEAEAEPPSPFPFCDVDPTVDPLGCESFWICATGITVNTIGMRFLPVAPGEFEMGSPETERGRFPDETLHTVVLGCWFYLSETEVTQGQYVEVMGENPSYANGTRDGRYFGTLLTRPVERVSWFDAVEFCRRLSLREGRRYRLPYEAEWEYACRAGTRTRFWFGDLLECSDAEMAPCPAAYPFMFIFEDADYPDGIGAPVAQKKPNPWGFYDMHGTAAEWCFDWYAPYPEKGSVVVNPVGPPTGTSRVWRGYQESIWSGKRGMRSAARSDGRWHSGIPDQKGIGLGFRVALELPSCGYGD